MATHALPGPGGPSVPGKPRDLTPQELIPVLLREARKRLVPLVSIFAAVALLTLLVGVFVIPRNYSASVTILAKDSDIIQPLLEGRAVSTGVADRAGMARQILFSRKILEQILAIGNWKEANPNPVEQERLMEEIRKRTLIDSPRPDLVQITYQDRDPQRAFDVTEAFGSMLITEALATKARESRDAYEFIDSQVSAYHAKLTGAENNLQQYRSENVDAQPGSATDVNARIVSLRNQVEQTRMTMQEQQSLGASLSSQLSGESAVSRAQTRENLLSSQYMELQAERDRLMLSFTEQHPDVVRVTLQMQDIQQNLARAQTRVDPPLPGIESAEAQANPLYRELRSQLALARREGAAAGSRLSAAQSMLAEELDRSRRIAASEGALAELTRDYEVNREIYQDLLRRRENARVSMGLDEANRGLTLKIQDPAIMPLRPSGMRLMHIAAAGLLLAIVLPMALVFLLARFDPRIRSARLIEAQSRFPLLTTIPAYATPRERRHELYGKLGSVTMILIVVLAYVATYALKMSHA
ncbi:XrtA system polysaccharide chain length determinant [Novilysobacter antarcticus]|uniref:XrtA system polysaccharide chain length determinant n=1 Tax=Novilysobacter antarcticus TaxID=2862543 RepID=UPI001C99620F|nr:XrtA system polysaccharide chain length determinant [Lysobacter antarcticus]